MAASHSTRRRRRQLRLARTVFVTMLLLILVVVATTRGGRHRAKITEDTHRPGSTTGPSEPPARPVAVLDPGVLPSPLSRSAVVVDDGQVLILGGLTDRGSTAQVLRFDPRSSAVTAAGTLARAVHDAAVARTDGTITVFGGGTEAHTIATVQRFTASGGAIIGALPHARSDLVAVTIGTHALVLGGFDGTTLAPDVLETDDGSAFRVVAQLPIPVRYPAIAVGGQSIYVVGGQTRAGQTAAVQRIDLSTGSAVVESRLPHAISDASAWFANGRLYVAGGRTGASTSSAVDVIDPATGSTTPLVELPMAVADAPVAVIDGNAYLIGGEGSTRLRSIVKVTFA